MSKIDQRRDREGSMLVPSPPPRYLSVTESSVTLPPEPKETIMRIPAILQGEARTRFLQGIAFGAVAAMTSGFIWGGWATGGTARTMSAMAESSGRMSILVPMCVAQFTAADGAVAKFKAAGSYSKDNVISEFVKTVASTNMDYSFAKAC